MKKLLFILACISLVSCGVLGTKEAKLEKNQDKMILLNDLWEVLSINGSDISINQDTDGIETPDLEINLADMEYTGSDGCNRFTGGIVELNEASIKFGMAASTRRMCEDMEIPDQVNHILPLVSTYKYKELTLWLFDEEGEEVMKLRKAD